MSEFLLLQIAPDCPVCHAHHNQSITRGQLREQLKKQVLELYCPRFDKRRPAAAEQRQTLMCAFSAFARWSEPKRHKLIATLRANEPPIQR
jgi:hypothetical protein